MDFRSYVRQNPAAAVTATAALMCLMSLLQSASGGDWSRFRGADGSGVSPEATPPVEFGDARNLSWKTPLPGPGASSPVIADDRVIVTCWSGYGTGAGDPGRQEDLQRNVICLDRRSGNVLWQHAEPAVLPEDTYRGMLAEHGYCSHTPVTDGERVYVFFGKTGVLALQLNDGVKLWHQQVGDGLEERRWGSASSPVLHGDLLIVAALIEGNSLIAFHKQTGEIAWKQEVPGYTGTWGTPVIVPGEGQRAELVLAVPGEVWGVNPETGKLRWFCLVPGIDSVRASVIARDGVIYAMHGRGGGCVAIRAGGKGDVTSTHLVWQNDRDRNGIGTTVAVGGRLYLISNRVITSLDAGTGERIEQLRLRAPSADGEAGAENSAEEFGPPYGRGGGAGQDYSSPVVGGDHLFYTARSGDLFVVHLGDRMSQVAVNRLDSGGIDYSATPAMADGQLFVRSASVLYCLSQK